MPLDNLHSNNIHVILCGRNGKFLAVKFFPAELIFGVKIKVTKYETEKRKRQNQLKLLPSRVFCIIKFIMSLGVA